MEDKTYLKIRNYVLNILTEIYIFAIIIVFPLCVDSTGFFKILECKYRVFQIIYVFIITNGKFY